MTEVKKEDGKDFFYSVKEKVNILDYYHEKKENKKHTKTETLKKYNIAQII